MGFFAELSGWLNGILASYISTNTARVAQVLEPAIVTLGVLYVMCWGFLHLTGRIEQPFLEGLKRIAVVALILGMSLQLWLYNDVIVDTFFNAPSQLAAAIVGAYDSVTIIDAIIDAGDQTASLLLQKGGLFGGDITYYIAGFAVYALVYVTAIYTMFLLLLSRVALSILLALGPLFIALLFFESTKRFVEAWLAQLANYAFVAILAVLVAALMLTVLGTAAQQAVSTGGSITLSQAGRVCIAAGLTLLMLKQVMPMAAGLASGIALSSFGVVSGVMSGAVGTGARALRQFARGAVMDRETSRWDPLSRKAGYALQRGVRGIAGSTARWAKSPNTIRS
jgi:type IV secretion system protein VirB6